MSPLVRYPARIGCLRLLVLALGLLPLGNSRAQERPRLGYWKLAGPAEFWISEIPPKGAAKHSYSGGWKTTYEITDGKVRFTNTLPPSKALIVGEVTWARPPAAIHPGGVVDVAGTAALLEFESAGMGFGAEVGLTCQFGPKGPDRPGQDRGLATGTLLLGMDQGGTLKARSHGSGGVPARRKVEYKNTDGVFGQKGQLYTGPGAAAELYLVYTTSGAGHSPRVAYRYVWAPVE